ncbi:ABC transporter permease [Nocardioides sp. DS6]|uniref:ABC transporter permease n=1 Tax=Nocardioides eburneus TaxID=3231482 RepID=A0ABV3SYJ4_9ACTN
MNTVANTSPAASRESAVDTRATRPTPWWRQALLTRATAILALDIALFVLFTALSDNGVFASSDNVQALLLAGTEALLLAVGLAMMLGAGIFDLSLGANLVLSSVVGARVMLHISTPAADGTYPHAAAAVLAGLLACVVTGAVFGTINGLLVAYLRINALIATLGTLGIGTGIGYVISNGTDLSGVPTQLQENFGLRTIGVLPVPALVALVVATALYVCIRYTRFGMRTLAIGSSFSAADRVGIKAPRHLLKLAILGGALAGVAGFIDLSHFGSTAIQGHSNDALNAVTAAVIGGTMLEGGKVSIIGALWGTALAVILQSGLVIVGVSSYYQLIAVGGVLILAVALDRLTYIRRRAT